MSCFSAGPADCTRSQRGTMMRVPVQRAKPDARVSLVQTLKEQGTVRYIHERYMKVLEDANRDAKEKLREKLKKKVASKRSGVDSKE